MGLSKQLDREDSSFSTMSYTFSTTMDKDKKKSHDPGAVGTVGWQAPELLMMRNRGGLYLSGKSRHNFDNNNILDNNKDNLSSDPNESSMSQDTASSVKVKSSLPLTNNNNNNNNNSSRSLRRTQNVDVFSLGCVIYYVLSLGDHPFGQWFEREANIINNNYNLSVLSEYPDAYDLVKNMIQSDPLLRPSSNEICYHSFFWPTDKRLEFLVEFSDRLEQESADSHLMLMIESNAMSIVGSRWDRKLDSLLLEDMGKYRKYDANSVRDLLRVIRNKKHHYHELSIEIKNTVGSMPTEFYYYFDRRFPKLLLHCVDVAKRFISSEKYFSLLFPKDDYSNSRLKVDNNNNNSNSNNNNNLLLNTSQKSIINDDLFLLSPCPNGSNNNNNNITFEGLNGINSILLSEGSMTTSPQIDCVIWQGSAIHTSLRCNSWFRDDSDWIEGRNGSISLLINNKGLKKTRPSHLTKSATDLKYRTRLCTHWEAANGSSCPMRKKGKCIFAHGPLELRVKETRRDRWGRHAHNNSSNRDMNDLLRLSGGEDVLGAARSIEKVRAQDNMTDFI
eukprot:gene6944-9498_t